MAACTHDRLHGLQLERAMRVFARFRGHPLVHEAQAVGFLKPGRAKELAMLVTKEFDVSRATAYRLSRIALDVLGVGESIRGAPSREPPPK